MASSPLRLRLRLAVALVLLVAASGLPSAFRTSQTKFQPQASSTPAGTGAISGVVADGATGRPIAGALVALSDPKLKVSVGAITDSKGRFVFTDLPASQAYAFKVRKSGYYNIGVGQFDALAGPMTSIPLTTNEWRQHEDVVLWPFGSIGGAVVDEIGEPVVGIPVQVMTRVAVGGTFQWLAGPMANTDDRGVYRIDRLPRGTYAVYVPNVQSTVPPGTSPAVVAGYTPDMVRNGNGVVPPSFGLDLGIGWLVLKRYAIPPPIDGVLRAYPLVFYPGSPLFAGAAPIDIADGEQRANVNFTLEPVPALTVSGRVIGPPDALQGQVLRLISRDSPDESGNSEQATALVDPTGNFAFIGVPAGSYTLLASLGAGSLTARGATTVGTPGLLPSRSFSVLASSSGFSVTSPAGGVPYSGRTSLVVGAQDVAGVVLELRPSATISGRVVNEDGSPLSAIVNISLSGTGDPTFMRLSTQASLDAAPRGRFVLRGVLEGNYLLNVESLARASLVVKSITGSRGDYTDRPFLAVAGEEISDVVVTVTDQSAELTGVVRDREGATVPRAAVILFPSDRVQWAHFGLTPPRVRSAIASGREGFKLARLRAGNYLVVATDVTQVSAWEDPRFFAAAASFAMPVTLAWGRSAVLNLTKQQVTLR